MNHGPKSLTACLLVVVSFAALWADSTAQNASPEFTRDPIAAYGHGTFIGADGKSFTPDRAFVLAAQKYYIGKLSRQPPSAPAERTRGLIKAAVPEEAVANALYIQWLLEETREPGSAQLAAINRALQQRYLQALGRAAPGITDATIAKLKRDGITVMMATSNGGMDYIQECATHGVPIPLTVMGWPWVDRGVIPGSFMSPNAKANLWQFGNNLVPGMCLARTVGNENSNNRINTVELICHSILTDKACFWAVDGDMELGIPVAIGAMVGGADLNSVPSGVCSDCHAGENPFVVMPGRVAFDNLFPKPTAANWYEPLVHASWPQNPGPTHALDAVSSPKRCDDCHQQGLAGRFPEPSKDISGWCATVLAQSVQQASPGTMPPDDDHANYQAHIDELLLLCQYPDSDGHLVGAHFENDPAVLSAPTIVDPLFACAERVTVRGGIIGAELSLFLNGHPVATKISHDPDGEEFVVPALKIGNLLTASQKLGGTVSDQSAPVNVQDHKVVYPKGLPPPAVDPGAVFQCASVAAVRNVPGARITLFTNDAFPSSRLTSTGWTSISGGNAPFVVNDGLSAEQSLCGDVSKRSRPLKVGAPPTDRPTPKTPPGVLYGGQQVVTVTHMVNGALGEIRETGSGLHPNPIATFSSPVSHKNNVDVVAGLGRNLAVGDQIEASYKLCPRDQPVKVTSIVESCALMWAPQISAPHVGDTSVTVVAGPVAAVPGARIRIYDASAKEIGDGSGAVINLTRALTGSDVITAVQEVGTCTSQSGWQATVN